MKFFIFYFLFLTYLYSSTLNLSISSNPSRINPILSSDSASSEIADWIFNGLFKYDKDGNVVVDLATSYEFKDNTTLIIDLKKNVKWHDGEEFNAKDVIFTYKTITDQKIFSPYSSNYVKVKSVKELNRYKIEIKYKEPYFKALEIWMMGILPYHLLKDEKNIMTSDFNKKPIGTGAYTLDELKISKDIILNVNKNYFNKIPKIKQIRYKFVPDLTTSFYMLKQKELDLGNLTPIQVDRQIDNNFKNSFNIIEKQSFSYSYVGFNLKNEKFKNIKVREAISLAIDRQQMADILYFGHASISTGPFLKGSIAHNKDVKEVVKNKKKAIQILKSLGYTKDNPLTFTVITSAGSSTSTNIAQIIQHQLKQVDVKMKIRVMEWQAFLNTVVHPRNFEAVIMGWGLSLTPDARSIWHSSSDKKGGFNFIGYKNKEVDRLIEEAEVTIDKKEFSKIYQKIYRYISEDVPYLFLFVPNSITAISNNIKNVSPSFIGVMHNQEDWEKEINIKE
ncbi:MAG: peptide-binding protein [Campylobacterota bacterium]|nr:peptide-binding protein [Campylobacterota bacterium]